ncbi:LPS translocon maturation chaperone LptM [Alteromonas aestuariivivens]|uniref:LPS translocon maturation chaperone LptM n=1 Tax=Alteromonas aestuariivivens TaxID=1938339 RepID=UPI0011C05560
MRNTYPRLLLTALLCLACYGCGYKGALYLPETAPANQQPEPNAPADNSGDSE